MSDTPTGPQPEPAGFEIGTKGHLDRRSARPLRDLGLPLVSVNQVMQPR